jgi:hypothetical protein
VNQALLSPMSPTSGDMGHPIFMVERASKDLSHPPSS